MTALSLPAPLWRPLLREQVGTPPTQSGAQEHPHRGVWVKGRRARAPAGQIVYAIGDIHGRADLLDRLLSLIASDKERSSCSVRPALVFLGDYVDRGWHSRDVIDRILAVPLAEFEQHFLLGNHEAALLDFIEHPATGPAWLNLGGGATMQSYGVKAPPRDATPAHFQRAAQALREALPATHTQFLSNLDLYLQLGNYVFVHAGLKPGKALWRQTRTDMLEIREEFLKSRSRWPFVVVHGHSPIAKPARIRERIALDTAAYATGRLSAVRLFDDEIAFITT